MIKPTLLFLALVAAFVLGSYSATVNHPHAPRHEGLSLANPMVDSPPLLNVTPSLHPFWHWDWHNFREFTSEFYHRRSPIGQLIVGLHDPEIRAVAHAYLGQAWDQIKDSTARISPEAASKLTNELEPFAQKTLNEVEKRIDEEDPF